MRSYGVKNQNYMYKAWHYV